MKFLFDLGGVFFNWDPNHFFINIFNDPKERNYFLKNICNDAWNIQQDAGRSAADAELELIPKFPQYEKQIKMYYANHRNMVFLTNLLKF
jgi:2-haloacid dehalogenase